MNQKYLLAELEDNIVNQVTSYVSKVPRPFGAVMSGGFDSGLLCALTKPDYLFRVKFPYGTKFDESRYADAVLKHLGMEDKMTEIVITEENFKENFVEAVKVVGKPTSHFSLVPLYIMMKTMREHGVVDVLSGEGPDEYLGGYARQIIFDELKKLYEIPELRNYHEMISRLLEYPEQFTFGSMLVDEYARLLGYRRTNDEGVNSYLKLYEDGVYPLQGIIGKMDMELGHVEEMEQKIAKHFGINFHYPYINEVFAEYCYKLPDDLKIRNGVTKWGFKQIAMKYLPEIMRDRSKMGGPVCPVNKFLGCENETGDWGKEVYLQKQKEILDGKDSV